MNIFQKILVAPIVAIAFLLILSAVGYRSMREQQNALDDLYNARIGNLEIASNAKSSVLDVHSRTYRLMTWADSLDPKKLEAESKSAIADADKLIAEFGQLAKKPDLTDDETKLAKAISEQLSTYRKSVASSIDFVSIDMNTALASMQNADDNFKKLNQLTGELVNVENTLSKSAFEKADAAGDRAIFTAISTLLLAVVASVGISLFMARGISSRVVRAGIRTGARDRRRSQSACRKGLGVRQDRRA